MSRRCLFWVQHLLGIGHVRRADAIARALLAEGWEVVVAQGGFPVEGVDYSGARVVQLPPARARDARFEIVDAAGRRVDTAWKKRRAAAVLELAAGWPPDLLLLETFPFGRRAFRFELQPLIEIQRRRGPRPLVAASVRDALVPKADPAKEAEMAGWARAWLDLVLVHGDPRLIPFEATFPKAAEIADLVRYTGYVGDAAGRPEPPPGEGAGEVIVSAGGGAVGGPLLLAALEARPLTGLADRTWRFLIGPETPDAVRRRLEDAAREAGPGTVRVEPARPDFPGLLARAALSISQAGYNTVMDLLGAGCAAVVVPFAEGGESEQTLRARLLAERGWLTLLEADRLTPRALAEAADAARPPSAAPVLARDGAQVAARRLAEALAALRGGAAP